MAGDGVRGLDLLLSAQLSDQLPQRTSPMLNLAQRGDRGLVRSWKRVQVLACGRDTGVAEALAHDSTSKMTVLRATLAMWFST